MTALPARIAAAFVAACRDELDAPKPGNVHVFADGHRMMAAEFVRSAEAAAAPLTASGTRVGLRILRAVEATRAAVGTNTNLGIVLLCAPLAAAAEAAQRGFGLGLRTAVSGVLDRLDVEDATLAFKAIALAAPGGLGEVARHDVRRPATVTLAQAMAEAADRDRIAHQFSSDFADIFDRGMTWRDIASARRLDAQWVTLAVYLGFLATFPDSHVVRKYGATVADDLCRTAAEFERRLRSQDPASLLGDLLAWDRSLKQRAINPGTSADLTVATLFAHRLTSILPTASNSG
jgi:triphosphoribosyl-dephospho-CoA synthase